MKRSTTAFCLSLTLLGACATPGKKDPEAYETLVKQREQSNAAIKADAQFVPKIMQDFDKSIDKYFQARAKSPDQRAVQLKESFDRILRQEVRKNFDLLVMKAEETRDQEDREIALVALGFADESAVEYVKRDGYLTKQAKTVKGERRYADAALNCMITALQETEPRVVEKALLGLGLLAHENTPITEIGVLLEDSKQSADVRRNASWALSVMQAQITPERRKAIRPIFIRLLSQPLGDVDPPVVAQALYSLGNFRNSQDAKVIQPYCKHPMGLIRVRAAIALGKIKNQESFPALLELIKESETNENVRLVARKSLKALAGGVDRGYDVKLWQRLFQRK